MQQKAAVDASQALLNDACALGVRNVHTCGQMCTRIRPTATLQGSMHPESGYMTPWRMQYNNRTTAACEPCLRNIGTHVLQTLETGMPACPHIAAARDLHVHIYMYYVIALLGPPMS